MSVSDDENVDNVNKVEPKFKVGEWIISDTVDKDYHICKITGIKDGNYMIESTCGYKGYNKFDVFDNAYRLWTIDDAKAGDVLSFYSEYKGNKMVQVGIIEKYVGKHGGCSNTFKIYVGVNWENNLQIGEYMGCSDILPATKEQRDTLFAKMHEAGYEWDAEKKELKKIDVELTDFERSLKHIMLETLECGDTHNLKADAEMLLRFAQKPAEWSEEDKYMIKNICHAFEKGSSQYKWLKSLKSRVQPKQWWSEEDERMIDNIIFELEENQENISGVGYKIDWLESLKQRIGWKPSDEQMKLLQEVIDVGHFTSYPNALETLYEQLKKLKGE